ncbi:MAG: ArnT family glycosyltransferase [Saprospiraceae bacterium]
MAKAKRSPVSNKPSVNTDKIQKPVPIGLKMNKLAALETWLSERTKWVAAGIFLVSMILHTVFFQQVKGTPVESIHKWANSDMAFFDQSARYIARGNWLCDTVLHPFHDWHNILANNYFKQYPQEAQSYYLKHLNQGGVIDTLGARRAWVNGIYQGKVYHQEPMYVYLLAITYRLFGTDPNWVFGWQLLLAALTNVGVFLLGRRYFGSLTGLLAVLLVMLSGPILVFQITLLRTSLTTFLSVLLLYCYQKMLDNNDRKSQLIFGAVGGIALLTQSYFLLFLLPAIAWSFWENRANTKETARALGYVVGALLLLMLPLFLRNIMVGVPVTAMAGHGGINFILFNSGNAEPLEPNYIHLPSAVQLMHDSGGKFFPSASACMNSFDGLGDILHLLKTKVDGLFIWYEVPNNMSYYVYKEFSPLLKAMPAPYWLIAPLGICGVIFGFWRFRWRFIPLFLMILVSASPLFISASLARFRPPFVILMSLSAAYFILDIVKNVLSAKWKEILIGVILFGSAWLYTSNIREKHFFVYFQQDIMSFYNTHYKSKLLEFERSKNLPAYLAATTELMGYIPDYYKEVRQNSNRAIYSNEASSCEAVSSLFIMHANLLQANGREAESAKFRQQAVVLNNIANSVKQKKNR